MVRAAAPRQPSDQLGRELHCVEGRPAPLFLVIGKAAGLTAFRLKHIQTHVHQADFDSPLVEPKGNSIDSPRVVEAQKPGIVRRKRIHPGNLRRQ
jgi:hypothetical protein